MKQRLASVTAATLALAGCAQDGTPEFPKLNVVSDNYCAIAKKVTWDVTDTWQTIDEARRHNERIDKLCPRETSKEGQPKATS